MDTELTGVPETALWTLRNRAVEAARPDTALPDPMAVTLYERLGRPGARFGRPSQAHALRARCFDDVTRAFLAAHPGGTVVALGEGLQTSYWRIGDPHVSWVSVDLPEMVALRRRLLPDEPGVRLVARSALDRRWLDEVDPGRSVLVTTEGLLMYFEPREVLALVRDCAARFPGGALVFDSIPPWFSQLSRHGLHLTPGYVAPPMPFGISAATVRRRFPTLPGVASAEEVPVPAGRGPWFFTPWLSRLPVLDGIRPSVTLLRFDPRSPSA